MNKYTVSSDLRSFNIGLMVNVGNVVDAIQSTYNEDRDVPMTLTAYTPTTEKGKDMHEMAVLVDGSEEPCEFFTVDDVNEMQNLWLVMGGKTGETLPLRIESALPITLGSSLNMLGMQVATEQKVTPSANVFITEDFEPIKGTVVSKIPVTLINGFNSVKVGSLLFKTESNRKNFNPDDHISQMHTYTNVRYVGRVTKVGIESAHSFTVLEEPYI